MSAGNGKRKQAAERNVATGSICYEEQAIELRNAHEINLSDQVSKQHHSRAYALSCAEGDYGAFRLKPWLIRYRQYAHYLFLVAACG